MEEECKKIDISKQKTGLVDTTEEKATEMIILDNGPFYKVVKIDDKKFSVEI